jgi:predicted Zn-dependent protease
MKQDTLKTPACKSAAVRVDTADGTIGDPDAAVIDPRRPHISRRLLLKTALAGGSVAVLGTAGGACRADIFTPSVADQKKVGQQAAQQILQKYPEVHDERARHFQRVGARLVDALPARDRSTWDFSFHVLNSKEINAFALPGGPMFMFTGLMDRVHSDDELAAVTGHEMTHVRKQHWAKAAAKEQERSLLGGVILGVTHAGRIWQLVAGGLNTVIGLKYSRTEEDEADAGGLQNMVDAGYDPHGMLALFHTLQAAGGGGGGMPGFLSDHPLTSERIRRTQQRIDGMSR